MEHLPKTIRSLEVAEMVDRRHDQVLRDITTIIKHLSTDHKSVVSEYFIESSYEDKTGRTLPCFLLTKKGCELYGTRMTGEKGTQFAVKYIDRFNQMEECIKQEQKQLTAREQLLLIMQANEETAQRVDVIEEKVNELHDTMRIDGNQEKQIKDNANIKVITVLGGKQSNAYKQISGSAFRAFWKEFKDYFKIPRYGELPKVKFDEALHFISVWQPPTALKMEIEIYNRQMHFESGDAS